MKIMIEEKDEYTTHLYLVKKDGSLRFVSCIEQDEADALMHYSSSISYEEEAHGLIGIYTTDIRDGLKMWIASIHKDELKEL